MSAQISTGPRISTGNLNTSLITDTDIGPDLGYQGFGFVDPRYSFDITGKPGRAIRGFYGSLDCPVLDGAPQASAAACLVAAATVPVTTATTGTAGLAAGFVSANLAFVGQTTPAAGNIAANIPILPYGLAPTSDNIVVVPATLEFGFAAGGNIVTTVAGSAVITLSNATQVKDFYVGQPLLVAGAGNAAGTAPLRAVVTAISGTSITLSTPALATLASGTQVGTEDGTLGISFPYRRMGISTVWGPTQGFTRNIRVVSNNVADTGYSLIVRGYDAAFTPMTEVIAVTANGTAYGKKAWKYVTQCNLYRATSTTTTGTISVGTGDLFGLSIRSDNWEYVTIFHASTQGTSTPGAAGNGWVAADATTPSGTTGDVRGTVQVSANGPSANFFAGGAPNGTLRTVVFLQVPVMSAAQATNLNYTTMFGNTQYTG